MNRKFSRLLLGALILVLVGGYAVQSASACTDKTLTVHVNPSGHGSSPHNFKVKIEEYKWTLLHGWKKVNTWTTDSGTWSHDFHPGRKIVLTAMSTNVRFDKWEGDIGSNSATSMSITVYMCKNREVTAYFLWKLDIQSSAGGTTNPSGVKYYRDGVTKTVTAIPNSGYRFDHWDGCDSTSGADGSICSVTMNSDKTVTAHFVEQVTLTVNVDPSSSGNYVDIYRNSAYIASVTSSSSFTFDKGDSIKLEANPTSDYHFDYWSGVSCSGATCTFTINSDKTVTAHFVELHDLTVEVKDQSGGSIGCKITLNPPNSQYGDGDKETYEDGDSVTATAPSTCTSGGKDYRFYQWEGACSGSSCTVTMNSDKTVRAKYVEQNDLSVYVKDIHGTALSCKVHASWTSLYSGGSGSTDLGNGGSQEIDTGSSVTLTPKACSGYKFDHWEGDCSGSSCSFTSMTSDKTVTAVFIAQYDLTVKVNPSGGGTTNVTSGTYDDGTVVHIDATPSSGYRFDHWTGCDSVSGTVCTVTMNSDKTVTANFVKTWRLTVNVNPSGGGTTTPSEGTHVYDDGTSVTVTATPNPGYRFDHWSGDCTGSGVCTVTMNSDKTVTANFVKTWTLTVIVEPTGTGTTSPVSPGIYVYDDGTHLTFSASSYAGYEFDHWELDGTPSYGVTLSVTMTANHEVKAVFKSRTTTTMPPAPPVAAPVIVGCTLPEGYPYTMKYKGMMQDLDFNRDLLNRLAGPAGAFEDEEVIFLGGPKVMPFFWDQYDVHFGDSNLTVRNMTFFAHYSSKDYAVILIDCDTIMTRVAGITRYGTRAGLTWLLNFPDQAEGKRLVVVEWIDSNWNGLVEPNELKVVYSEP